MSAFYVFLPSSREICPLSPRMHVIYGPHYVQCTVSATRLRLVCVPRPRMRSPDLPRALQKCFAVACLGPGGDTAAEEKCDMLPFCFGSPSSSTLCRSFRSQELRRRDVVLILLAGFSTTDRQECDIRQQDAPACATSFVVTSGPLLMHRRHGAPNTPGGDAFRGTVVKGALDPRCCHAPRVCARLVRVPRFCTFSFEWTMRVQDLCLLFVPRAE